MKKIFSIILSVSIIASCYGQQTFTSGTQAMDYLKEIFAKSFIKTDVNHDDIIYQYEYEINEKHILIIKRDQKERRYCSVPYIDIENMGLLKKNDFFKKVSGIIIKPSFGRAFMVGYSKEVQLHYVTHEEFPFDVNKEDHISIINAINTIVRDIKEAAKAAERIAAEAKQKDNTARQTALAAANNKIKGSKLNGYTLFTLDNVSINLHDYAEKNRQFKDKPTLLITWNKDWGRPFMKFIDSLLNDGVALNYNIILINKGDKYTDLTKLKSNIAKHNPDYTKEVISLIDKTNALEPMDNNAVPFYLWLDNNMKIVSSYPGWDISTKKIREKLEEIK